MRARQLHDSESGSPRSRSGRAPGHPVVERVLKLQRRAGNRAVQAALVQRQVAGEAAGPLDATQVAAAIRFHTRQPERYTPEIMREIQGRLGVDQTGVADEATVQAIATFQQTEGTEHPELKVDGMAGPRTLPRMFPTGLKAPGEAQKFGEEAQTQVIDRWHELTPAQRAAELVRSSTLHPRRPRARRDAEPSDTGTNLGTFDFNTWEMDIGLEALSIAQPDRAQAEDVVDTIYHEARHAEQWFRIAQLWSLQRRCREGSAEGMRLGWVIATELQIPRRIADLAVTTPPWFALGSMDAPIAQGRFDSVYALGAPIASVSGPSWSAPARRSSAQQRFAADPTPANQAALERARVRRTRALDGHAAAPAGERRLPDGRGDGRGATRGAPPLLLVPGPMRP